MVLNDIVMCWEGCEFLESYCVTLIVLAEKLGQKVGFVQVMEIMFEILCYNVGRELRFRKWKCFVGNSKIKVRVSKLGFIKCDLTNKIWKGLVKW